MNLRSGHRAKVFPYSDGKVELTVTDRSGQSLYVVLSPAEARTLAASLNEHAARSDNKPA